jgi:hypothetical protein
VRLLRASIAGEASARGKRARELGKQARERINVDFDVDNPNTPPRASQKLVAAATLLRAMPAPQRQRRETCTARRRRSSSKRPFSRPKARRPASVSRGARGMTGARKALKHRYTRVARRNAPPTQGARRSGNGSLTRAGRPKTVTLATSSMPGGRATQRRGRRQSTTPGGVGAMTAGRTARQRRSPREPVCSAWRSARRASLSASASPRRSTNTTGRRTPAYGSTTTAWRASWAGPPPTKSSSATCRCTSPTRRGRGLSICRPARSTTGMIWSVPSWGTSRALTCALEAPWKLLGPARVHPEARRVAPGLHTALFQALHGALERGPV